MVRLVFGQMDEVVAVHRSSVGGHSPAAISRFRWLCPLLAVLALTSACVAAAEPAGIGGDEEQAEIEVVEETEVARTTIVPTMRPTPAEDLGIAVDRAGRPYDNYWGPQGATADIRFARTLTIDQGRLEIVDGESVVAGGPVLVRDTKSVDFRGTDELDLSIIWKKESVGTEASAEPEAAGSADDEAEDRDPVQVESILGVIVQRPDTTVARWGEFQRAYQTNEGLGAVTSRASLDWSVANLDAETPLGELVDTRGAPFAFLDVNDDDLDDLFLFDNGTDGEAGTYFLSRGLDEDDVMVAVTIWHGDYPWRLAVPIGEPPPDVTDREEQLIDCIEGRRLIDKWGRCT